MGKMPFFQFYPHDWLYDTRICTPAEKAVLIDLLCFMWNAPKRGILFGDPQDLARLVGMEWADFKAILNALKRKNILTVKEEGDDVSILSRRMAREEKRRESNRFYQSSSRERRASASCQQNVSGNKSEDRSQKTEVIKDKDIITVPAARARATFSKPTIEEVRAYCQERRNRVDVDKWFAHYESNGWRVGKNPMKDWRAAVRTWERSDFVSPNPRYQEPLNAPAAPTRPLISQEEIEWRKEMDEKRKDWNQKQKMGLVKPGEQPPWLPPFPALRLKVLGSDSDTPKG